MKNHETIYSEVIKNILYISDQLQSTSQSWRGEYLKSLAAEAEKALFREKEELVELIIQNCQKAIDRWDIKISQKEDDNKLQHVSNIGKNIDRKLENYLKMEKETYVQARRAIFLLYFSWSNIYNPCLMDLLEKRLL